MSTYFEKNHDTLTNGVGWGSTLMVSLIIKYRMFLTSAPSAKVTPTLDGNHCEEYKSRFKRLSCQLFLQGQSRSGEAHFDCPRQIGRIAVCDYSYDM